MCVLLVLRNFFKHCTLSPDLLMAVSSLNLSFAVKWLYMCPCWFLLLFRCDARLVCFVAFLLNLSGLSLLLRDVSPFVRLPIYCYRDDPLASLHYDSGSDGPLTPRKIPSIRCMCFPTG